MEECKLQAAVKRIWKRNLRHPSTAWFSVSSSWKITSGVQKKLFFFNERERERDLLARRGRFALCNFFQKAPQIRVCYATFISKLLPIGRHPLCVLQLSPESTISVKFLHVKKTMIVAFTQGHVDLISLAMWTHPLPHTPPSLPWNVGEETEVSAWWHKVVCV